MRLSTDLFKHGWILSNELMGFLAGGGILRSHGQDSAQIPHQQQGRS